ncbi:oxygen-dependent protoporphyrinogen oxidase [Arcanobacterium wilhelmae]|uniref:Oxygen-dependent protoporphyrinogen oxidase n=1 Tax=Arcanobacterium wilhelmae TaxID=1803177 RepID=A0ABT9NBW4_9ACTO|nr:FAD-dependent oxidoreductase [Arcanobacterium wilhelmae]MDP9800988.1 oxygen-dependent protoporphyrinogen oxidase [Arcanobacterium wilhelmae]WFN90348.1 FAD-dependent oxidoreductase [Arcanobacterium wilhelmae]
MIGIVGGGLAGLVMAKELAEAGKRVVLFEERPNLGGLIPAGRLAGVSVDFGADAYTRRNPDVTEYIRSLGLRPILPNGRSWIYDGDAFPIPANATCGIPADVANPDVVGLLADPARVARDLELGPEVGAGATTMGELVRARMGEELMEKIVAPIVSAVYSIHPDRLALDPVLGANFARLGTLSAAVAAGLDGPAIGSIEGGMSRLPLRLAQLARAAGAEIRTGAKVVGLEPGAILVRDAGATGGAAGAAGVSGVGEEAGVERVEVEHIIVATGIARAVGLLPGVMECEPIEIPAGRLTTHVNLALNAPELREGPRGSGILTKAGTCRAKAISHMSHKWPWLREASECEFLRVSYAVNEQVPIAHALEDASLLLGVQLREEQVRDSYVLRWGGALTPSTPALREWAAGLRVPSGVSVVGVWRAGSGISAVLPHALAEADRILGREPGAGVGGADAMPTGSGVNRADGVGASEAGVDRASETALDGASGTAGVAGGAGEVGERR